MAFNTRMPNCTSMLAFCMRSKNKLTPNRPRFKPLTNLGTLGLLCFIICNLHFATFPSITHAVKPYTPTHPDPVLEPWRWRSFPELKGLGLQCLAESQDGTMWFGVENGVIQYDGLSWTTYTETDGIYGSPVTTLCPIRDGSMLAGTAWGVSSFKNGKWHRIFPTDGDIPWPVGQITEISDGTIWIGTGWGALHFSKTDTILYTVAKQADAIKKLMPNLQIHIVPDEIAERHYRDPPRKSTDIYVIEGESYDVRRRHPPNIVWHTDSAHSGVRIGDRILKINGDEPRRGETRSDRTLALTVLREGHKKPLEITVEPQEINESLHDFSIYSIFEDRDKNLWFSFSIGAHVVQYKADAKKNDQLRWRRHPETRFQAGLGYAVFAQTNDGAIWVANRWSNHGLNRFDGKNWRHRSLTEMGGGGVNPSILTTKDNVLWVGGGAGQLHRFQNSNWSIFSAKKTPTPRNRMMSLISSSSGALWMAGVNDEAVQFDNASTRWQTFDKLNFQCETSDGSQWFITQDSSIVRYVDNTWTRYNSEDGLMAKPTALITTRNGKLWAAGVQNEVGATAHFQNNLWHQKTHPDFGQRTKLEIFEDTTGMLWFSSRDRSGLLTFDGKKWQMHETPSWVYAIGQTHDGTIWGGSLGLRKLEGDSWQEVSEPNELKSWIASVLCTRNGDLWVGTRASGVFKFDGQRWTQYNERNGLTAGSVENILQSHDGSIWIATSQGINRFDGATWTAEPLPFMQAMQDESIDLRGISLQQSKDGAFWINLRYQKDTRFQTIRYFPDQTPPTTQITTPINQVSQPGNITLFWKGVDPWRDTPNKDLQFSYRINKEDWSAYSSNLYQTYFTLPSGNHTFEVKARDRDFNEDPTPALVHFTVIPPIYQQAWFIALVAIFLTAITFQTIRVVRRDRRLIVTNEALSDANKKLFQVNTDLQHKTQDLESANQTITEQTERKSRFLSNISHELRTPLTAIKGYTDNLLEGIAGDLTERQERGVSRIGTNSVHMLNLVNDLLDIARIEAGRVEVTPETFNIRDLIIACCDTVAPLAKSGVTLTHDIADNINDAHTDQGRVRQILINLLSNALKFTEQGEVEISASKDNSDILTLSVSDTGTGIPQDDLATIFEEFKQVKGSDPQHKGTGLGLPITKGFVELLGGSISVESEVGKGSTFTLVVPARYQQ